MKRKTELLRLCVLIAGLALPASGSIIIDRFDDLNSQPVDGLMHLGITYSFTVAGVSSADAIYGAPFPSDSIIGPSVLMGPTRDLSTPSDFAVLTLSFDNPTGILAFAIAFSTTAADEFTVILTDDMGVTGTPVTISVAPDPTCDTSTNPCFSEATYIYSGLEPISTAKFNFSDTGADAFAIGTLEYATAVPEPRSLLLSGALALLLITAARRKAPGSSN